MNMTLKTQLAAAALVLLGSQAQAATYNFDFVGDGSLSTSVTNFLGSTFVTSNAGLTDVATGGNTPEFTLSVGDVVSGAVTLSNSVTVGASSQFSSIALIIGGNLSASVTQTENIVFYKNGAQIVLPTSFYADSNVAGALTIGVYSLGATPAVTFDEIKFNDVITGLGQGTSTSISGSTADLNFEFVPLASPVPEPASVALLLAGLGAIGVAGRRRGQSTK